MTKQAALPPTLPPRLIGRDAAAAYINVSPNVFDAMVDDGRMPQPKMLTEKRRAWDVRALDTAVDQLPVVSPSIAPDKTWGDIDAT